MYSAASLGKNKAAEAARTFSAVFAARPAAILSASARNLARGPRPRSTTRRAGNLPRVCILQLCSGFPLNPSRDAPSISARLKVASIALNAAGGFFPSISSSNSGIASRSTSASAGIFETSLSFMSCLGCGFILPFPCDRWRGKRSTSVMAIVRPFRGLRPPSEIVRLVACPPYDVVSVEEARAYARDNERSFFHISRPEIDFPAGTDEHSSEVYAQGLRNLQRFQEKGWLRGDLEPTFYVYRQVMGKHVQAGLVAGASLDEYDRGLIKKHELTRPDKEDDRTRHIEALDGNDEPVFLTYRARPEIDALVAGGMGGEPEDHFSPEDRIQHTFWIVRGEANARVAEVFGRVPELYVADGHHRSAAAPGWGAPLLGF